MLRVARVLFPAIPECCAQMFKCVCGLLFPQGRKELDLSCFQAVVLCAFNGRANAVLPGSDGGGGSGGDGAAETVRRSFGELAALTGLAAVDLRRTLHSLACHPKVRVLVKEPRGKEVGDRDDFFFDAAFSSKLFRLRLNAPKLSNEEAEAGSSRTHEEVKKDRTYAVEAAIVSRQWEWKHAVLARKEVLHLDVLLTCSLWWLLACHRCGRCGS